MSTDILWMSQEEQKSTCVVLLVAHVYVRVGGREPLVEGEGLRDPLMARGVFDDSCSNVKLTGVSYVHLIFVIKSHRPSD